MAKKMTVPNEGATPETDAFREKRKWQISLRRYVLEGSPCVEYAPYFGLDAENMRKWVASQFREGMNWDNFGKEWQFEQIIPVSFFDLSKEPDLKICWSFINLRVEHAGKSGAAKTDLLVAKSYFRDLYEATGYAPCITMLQKIEEIEANERLNTEKQQDFIRENKEYLENIRQFSAFEFELLNAGRSVAEIKKEMECIKNIKD